MVELGKKIYCTNCKKLVKSRQEKDRETTSILCNSCGTSLYSWDGITWKYLGGEP